jgi:hypothetical protein
MCAALSSGVKIWWGKIKTKLWPGQQRNCIYIAWGKKRFFSFLKCLDRIWGPPRFHMQQIAKALSIKRIKRLCRETGHSSIQCSHWE